ncbi:hypothetical protein ACJX0J_029540, partial [Zea mays]
KLFVSSNARLFKIATVFSICQIFGLRWYILFYLAGFFLSNISLDGDDDPYSGQIRARGRYFLFQDGAVPGRRKQGLFYEKAAGLSLGLLLVYFFHHICICRLVSNFGSFPFNLYTFYWHLTHADYLIQFGTGFFPCAIALMDIIHVNGRMGVLVQIYHVAGHFLLQEQGATETIICTTKPCIALHAEYAKKNHAYAVDEIGNYVFLEK